MAVLEIKTYPDLILKKKATEITEIDGNIHKLIDGMLETMYKAKGIGLAAPQVGISKRLIVININSQEKKYSPLVIINPQIVSKEGEILSEEGCLSIPGFFTTLKRSEKVFVKGIDRKGKEIEIETNGLLGRAIQHEIDHLDGILLIDRISPLKRELFKKKYLKTKK
jgi:peptide deformylase